jgi:hypothetical protein
VRLFKPTSALLSDQPLVTDDNSMHSYYTQLGAQLIARSGQPYGYVPMEMAGHPKTPIYDAGIVPVERLMATLSFLPPFLVYKLFILLGMAAIALSALFALRLLGLGGAGWAFGWALVMFHYWWGQGMVFTMGGMNTWLLAASLSFLLLATVARLVTSWTWPLAALAGALMCLAPYVHPIGSVSVLLAAGVLLVMRRTDWRRTGLFVAGCGVLALLINGAWMLSTAQHKNVGTPLGEILGASESPLHLWQVAWSDLRSSPGKSQLINRLVNLVFNLWVVGLGIAGLVWLRRRRDPRFVPLLVPFVVLGVLTYFTRSLSALQNIQPWRLRFLFLLVASASAALVSADWLRSRGWRRWLAWASGAFAVLYFLSFDARPDVPPLQVGFDEVQRQWVAEINQIADERARLLAEDGSGYRGMGLAALHLGTHTQWVGGPYRGAYITYHRVNFFMGKLNDRPIGSYDDTELAAFLRRYNVHWVMAWTPESKQSFDGRVGLLRRLKEIGGLAFYEVVAPVDSFFERGAGKLSVELDQIRLENVVPENGRVVLRYHYYEHLVAEGARGLRPYPIPGDQVPFIEVVEPSSTVTIRTIHTRR